MTERERYRQFIAYVGCVSDSDGKLARRVLDGMTLDEAMRDLEETRRRQLQASTIAQRANA